MMKGQIQLTPKISTRQGNKDITQTTAIEEYELRAPMKLTSCQKVSPKYTKSCSLFH